MKTCLKFFSGSLLHSGKNSKLVNMPWGSSQSVPVYRFRLNSLLLCFQPNPGMLNSFPRTVCSLTPFPAAPLLLLSFLKIQPRMQCAQEPSPTSTNWGNYTSYVTPQSTLGFPLSLHLSHCLLSRNGGRSSVYFSSLHSEILSSRDEPYSFLHCPCLTQHLAHSRCSKSLVSWMNCTKQRKRMFDRHKY